MILELVITGLVGILLIGWAVVADYSDTHPGSGY